MEVIKRIVKYMLVILPAVFVVNLFYWFFIDREEVLIYISSYAGKNLDILNREQATKIVVTGTSFLQQDKSENRVLSDDPEFVIPKQIR